MAWDVVSQTQNTVLPATRVNQLQDNFAALAAQNSGAPVVTFPNSVLNANAGIGATGVGSFGSLNVSSGFGVLGVGSFGSLNASSGFRTTEVASVGLLDASSGIEVGVVAPAAPEEGVYYRDMAIRAWCVCSANGTFYSRAGVSAVTRPSAGVFVITLATSFRAAQSWACFGAAVSQFADGSVHFDPRSQTGGSIAGVTWNSGGAAVSSLGFSFFAVGS